MFVRYNQIMLRRNYIETSEVTDATEAQVALAEALIDDYVGYQDKFIKTDISGTVTASLTGKVVDANSNSPLYVTDGTYDRCVIEIIGGSGAGQSRVLIGSDRDDRSVSFEGSAFNPALDDTSVYRIYQLAKFPRRKDSRTPSGSNTFYKFIPEEVREAVRAEVQFIIEMGDAYFTGEDSEMDGERIMGYSYSRGGNAGQSALVKFISPQARVLLRGFKNRTGRIVVEHP